jgi:hypothetical protein
MMSVTYIKQGIRSQFVAFLVLFLYLLLAACASVTDLPGSAGEVSFVDHVAGVPPLREFDYCGNYLNANKEAVFEAVKFALIKQKFAIQRADFDKGVVRAEHGVSSYDWNIVTGIYFKEIPTGVAVKIIVRTSVSTSLYVEERAREGSITAREWLEKILASMEAFLQEKHNISTSALKCG